MSSPEHKQKIWNLIKDIRIGMMTTWHEGMLHARPMSLIQDEYNGTLWFFTEKTAGKTAEIHQDSHVCLSFANPDSETYVSLSGTARSIDDPALINKFWNAFAAAWFPKGKDDPNLGLIEVTIKHGEHWDATSSKVVQLIEIAKANITHKQPDMGEHEKF